MDQYPQKNLTLFVSQHSATSAFRKVAKPFIFFNQLKEVNMQPMNNTRFYDQCNMISKQNLSNHTSETSRARLSLVYNLAQTIQICTETFNKANFVGRKHLNLTHMSAINFSSCKHLLYSFLWLCKLSQQTLLLLWKFLLSMKFRKTPFQHVLHLESKSSYGSQSMQVQ